jgi:hypothetical protein
MSFSVYPAKYKTKNHLSSEILFRINKKKLDACEQRENQKFLV